MTSAGLPARPDRRTDRVDPPFRILSVCVANVCRSVFTERLLRRALTARLGHLASRFHTASAGTLAVPGRTIHPYVRDILGGYGAPADGFASRRLTAQMVAGADLVLTATAAVRDEVIALVPAALGRAFTLREFTRLGEHAAAARTDVPATNGAPATTSSPGTTGAPGDLRGRAPAIVAQAHRMRGLVPYRDPAAGDIADPGPSRAAFRECAAGIAVAATSASVILCPACPTPGGATVHSGLSFRTGDRSGHR